MSTSLQSLYTDLLHMCNVEVSSYGRLVVVTKDGETNEKSEIPLQYDGKPIVFPEKQFINDPENKDLGVIILHPLSESSLRGTSEVLNILRKAGILRLCYLADFLLNKSVELNHNATMDSSYKLNHKLSTLFSSVAEVDDKFVTFFHKVRNVIIEDTSKRLFNIYLKPEGEIDKKRFTRVCVVSSPLYDELSMIGDSKIVFGVEAPRKKDIVTLKSIMEALFPLLPENGYIVGSSSSVAPTLIAFMEAMSMMGKVFNKALETLGKEAKAIENGNTKGVDWDRDANLAHLRNVHPIEEYNVGVSRDEVEDDKQTDIKARRTPDAITIPTRETPTRTEKTVVAETTRDEPEESQSGFWNRSSSNDNRNDGRSDRTYRREPEERRTSYGSGSRRQDDRRTEDRRYDDRRTTSYGSGSSGRSESRYPRHEEERTTDGFWNNRR